MTSHNHADIFTEANKEFFDKFATQYEDLAIVRYAAKAVTKITSEVFDFDPEQTVALDFACGPGVLARELVPYTKRIVGVDISPGVIDKFNSNSRHLGLPAEKIQGHCVELKGKEGELGNQKFDIILCAQAYHHFGSIDDITRMLSFFLRPGGTLIVFDFMHPDDAKKVNGDEVLVGTVEDAEKMLRGHEVRHVVPHIHGVQESAMRQAAEGAGLKEFTYKYAFTSFRPEGNKQHFFVATAVKE